MAFWSGNKILREAFRSKFIPNRVNSVNKLEGDRDSNFSIQARRYSAIKYDSWSLYMQTKVGRSRNVERNDFLMYNMIHSRSHSLGDTNKLKNVDVLPTRKISFYDVINLDTNGEIKVGASIGGPYNADIVNSSPRNESRKLYFAKPDNEKKGAKCLDESTEFVDKEFAAVSDRDNAKVGFPKLGDFGNDILRQDVNESIKGIRKVNSADNLSTSGDTEARKECINIFREEETVARQDEGTAQSKPDIITDCKSVVPYSCNKELKVLSDNERKCSDLTYLQPRVQIFNKPISLMSKPDNTITATPPPHKQPVPKFSFEENLQLSTERLQQLGKIQEIVDDIIPVPEQAKESSSTKSPTRIENAVAGPDQQKNRDTSEILSKWIAPLNKAVNNRQNKSGVMTKAAKALYSFFNVREPENLLDSDNTAEAPGNKVDENVKTQDKCDSKNVQVKEANLDLHLGQLKTQMENTAIKEKNDNMQYGANYKCRMMPSSRNVLPVVTVSTRKEPIQKMQAPRRSYAECIKIPSKKPPLREENIAAQKVRSALIEYPRPKPSSKQKQKEHIEYLNQIAKQMYEKSQEDNIKKVKCPDAKLLVAASKLEFKSIKELTEKKVNTTNNLKTKKRSAKKYVNPKTKPTNIYLTPKSEILEINKMFDYFKYKNYPKINRRKNQRPLTAKSSKENPLQDQLKIGTLLTKIREKKLKETVLPKSVQSTVNASALTLLNKKHNQSILAKFRASIKNGQNVQLSAHTKSACPIKDANSKRLIDQPFKNRQK